MKIYYLISVMSFNPYTTKKPKLHPMIVKQFQEGHIMKILFQFYLLFDQNMRLSS